MSRPHDDVHDAIPLLFDVCKMRTGVDPHRHGRLAVLSAEWLEPAGLKATYRGVNVWLLSIAQLSAGYSTNAWGTYKAWSGLGAQVRRGEKATLVILWKPVEKRTIVDGERVVEQHLILREYHVFNEAQVDGFRRPVEQLTFAEITALVGVPVHLPQPTRPIPLKAGSDLFAALGSRIQYGGNRACYVPALDAIMMPEFECFDTPETFVSVLSHEHIHWSGHETRCNRSLNGRFGSNAYAMEELIAELGAAFLCSTIGVETRMREDHASYIARWLETLKSDKKAIFTASSQAQKAVDWLLAEANGDHAEVEEGETDEAPAVAMAA